MTVQPTIVTLNTTKCCVERLRVGWVSLGECMLWSMHIDWIPKVILDQQVSNFVQSRTIFDGMERSTYLDVLIQRRNQDHRYRLMDRTWYPNRCVLGYRIQSCRFVRNCHVSIRIHGPEIGRNRSIIDIWLNIPLIRQEKCLEIISKQSSIDK